MIRRKRLVFISTIAVPHQVAFCGALQEYFDARFWFYEHPDRTRGAWWRVDLGSHCTVLDGVLFPKSGPLKEQYFAPGMARLLDEFDPDIVMLGGFSKLSNYLAYRWARRRGKQTMVFTERSRNGAGKLRKRGIVWRLLRRLYRDVDLVMTSAEDAVPQYRDEFGFGNKVVACRYATDLEGYFGHPLRERKPAYVYLFANRLTEIYNPIGAIEIFAAVLARHPGSKLVMNASGELGGSCRSRIAKLNIGEAVEFLTGITSWRDLHGIYSRCDILLLPATFSNGNFTILEAMASGMGLVVSNRVLGVGRMVQDGMNGFNCDPTKEAFEERVERYIGDPGLLKDHAAINRPLVEPFSAKGTAAHFAEIVRHALGV